MVSISILSAVAVVGTTTTATSTVAWMHASSCGLQRRRARPTLTGRSLKTAKRSWSANGWGLSAKEEDDDDDYSPVDPFSTTTEEEDASPTSTSKSILEATLQADEDFAQMEFEFVDAESSDGRKYIPARIAFCTPSGLAIATPVHPAVVLYKSNKEDELEQALNPDDPHMEPYFEMAATVLQQDVGSHLSLQLTPRVLTVTGGLEQVVQQWNGILDDEKIDEDLANKLEGEVEGQEEQFLDSFFQNAFGTPNYQAKVAEMATPEMDQFIQDTIAPLFDIPGLGTEKDNVEGVRRMLLEDDDDDEEDALLHESEKRVGVRLVAFKGPEVGVIYTLVLLLKPVLLVGKELPNQDESRRLLLTTTEVESLLPKLEQDFQQELQDAGFVFD